MLITSREILFPMAIAKMVMLAALASSTVRSAERIELVAGGDQEATGIPAVKSRLKEPFGVAFDPANRLWIVEMVSGNRLLKIEEDGSLVHVAGRSEKGFSGDGGPALKGQFNGPHNLAIRPDGRVLIADTWNGRVRQIDPVSAQLDSLAGYEVPIDKAKGAGPYCITLDFSGRYLYIADLQRIHRLDLVSGQAIVVAGNGKKGIPRDGDRAVDAPLVDPRAVAADRSGNVYILERGGNALRVVQADGTIRTVVNISGKKGTARWAQQPTADNPSAVDPIDTAEPASSAMMNGPKHLCIDWQDRVVIADAENHLIRRFDPKDETLCCVAGTGKSGSAGVGGAPLHCQLARPHGVTVHPQTGELYITDSYNDRILRIARHQP